MYFSYFYNNNVQFAFDDISNKSDTEFEIIFTTKYNEKEYIFDVNVGFRLDAELYRR